MTWSVFKTWIHDVSCVQNNQWAIILLVGTESARTLTGTLCHTSGEKFHYTLPYFSTRGPNFGDSHNLKSRLLRIRIDDTDWVMDCLYEKIETKGLSHCVICVKNISNSSATMFDVGLLWSVCMPQMTHVCIAMVIQLFLKPQAILTPYRQMWHSGDKCDIRRQIFWSVDQDWSGS